MKVKLTLCLTLAITTLVFAQDHPSEMTKIDYGAGSKQPIPRNVYWGDTHLHTSFSPDAPFSPFDSVFPQDLWTYQEIYRNSGVDSIAIPHNGNVSDGWMYSQRKFGFAEGLIDARYATRQQLNEPDRNHPDREE